MHVILSFLHLHWLYTCSTLFRSRCSLLCWRIWRIHGWRILDLFMWRIDRRNSNICWLDVSGWGGLRRVNSGLFTEQGEIEKDACTFSCTLRAAEQFLRCRSE